MVLPFRRILHVFRFSVVSSFISTISFKIDSFELVFHVLNIFEPIFMYFFTLFLQDLFLGVELATLLFWESNSDFNGRPCYVGS